MRQLVATKSEAPDDVLVDILTRLWQTKQKSIALIEYWSGRTLDFDVRTGLKLQLADERHHLRLLGEELERRGGRALAIRDQLLGRAFAIAQAQPSDAYRLCAYFLGIKAFTLVRYSNLIPLVDPKLSRLFEQIAREEERHIRWAEIRISRSAKLDETRQFQLLEERIKATLDGAWLKPWRRLVSSRIRLTPIR